MYPKYKLVILLLLTLNVFNYAIFDSLIKSLDALAWVGLLVSFELEAMGQAGSLSNQTLHGLRNGLIVIVALIFMVYIQESEWLEVVNGLLWFVLIMLLELEIRWPDRVMTHQRWLGLASIAVFIGLIAMVVVWLWQLSWLAAYDAALWIAAFAVIEVDIFHFLRIKRLY